MINLHKPLGRKQLKNHDLKQEYIDPGNCLLNTSQMHYMYINTTVTANSVNYCGYVPVCGTWTLWSTCCPNSVKINR